MSSRSRSRSREKKLRREVSSDDDEIIERPVNGFRRHYQKFQRYHHHQNNYNNNNNFYQRKNNNFTHQNHHHNNNNNNNFFAELKTRVREQSNLIEAKEVLLKQAEQDLLARDDHIREMTLQHAREIDTIEQDYERKIDETIRRSEENTERRVAEKDEEIAVLRRRLRKAEDDDVRLKKILKNVNERNEYLVGVVREVRGKVMENKTVQVNLEIKEEVVHESGENYDVVNFHDEKSKNSPWNSENLSRSQSCGEPISPQRQNNSPHRNSDQNDTNSPQNNRNSPQIDKSLFQIDENLLEIVKNFLQKEINQIDENSSQEFENLQQESESSTKEDQHLQQSDFNSPNKDDNLPKNYLISNSPHDSNKLQQINRNSPPKDKNSPQKNQSDNLHIDNYLRDIELGLTQNSPQNDNKVSQNDDEKCTRIDQNLPQNNQWTYNFSTIYNPSQQLEKLSEKSKVSLPFDKNSHQSEKSSPQIPKLNPRRNSRWEGRNLEEQNDKIDRLEKLRQKESKFERNGEYLKNHENNKIKEFSPQRQNFNRHSSQERHKKENSPRRIFSRRNSSYFRPKELKNGRSYSPQRENRYSPQRNKNYRSNSPQKRFFDTKMRRNSLHDKFVANWEQKIEIFTPYNKNYRQNSPQDREIDRKSLFVRNTSQERHKYDQSLDKVTSMSPNEAQEAIFLSANDLRGDKSLAIPHFESQSLSEVELGNKIDNFVITTNELLINGHKLFENIQKVIENGETNVNSTENVQKVATMNLKPSRNDPRIKNASKNDENVKNDEILTPDDENLSLRVVFKEITPRNRETSVNKGGEQTSVIKNDEIQIKIANQANAETKSDELTANSNENNTAAPKLDDNQEKKSNSTKIQENSKLNNVEIDAKSTENPLEAAKDENIQESKQESKNFEQVLRKNSDIISNSAKNEENKLESDENNQESAKSEEIDLSATKLDKNIESESKEHLNNSSKRKNKLTSAKLKKNITKSDKSSQSKSENSQDMTPSENNSANDDFVSVPMEIGYPSDDEKPVSTPVKAVFKQSKSIEDQLAEMEGQVTTQITNLKVEINYDSDESTETEVDDTEMALAKIYANVTSNLNVSDVNEENSLKTLALCAEIIQKEAVETNDNVKNVTNSKCDVTNCSCVSNNETCKKNNDLLAKEQILSCLDDQNEHKNQNLIKDESLVQNQNPVKKQTILEDPNEFLNEDQSDEGHPNFLNVIDHEESVECEDIEEESEEVMYVYEDEILLLNVSDDESRENEDTKEQVLYFVDSEDVVQLSEIEKQTAEDSKVADKSDSENPILQSEVKNIESVAPNPISQDQTIESCAKSDVIDQNSADSLNKVESKQDQVVLSDQLEENSLKTDPELIQKNLLFEDQVDNICEKHQVSQVVLCQEDPIEKGSSPKKAILGKESESFTELTLKEQQIIVNNSEQEKSQSNPIVANSHSVSNNLVQITDNSQPDPNHEATLKLRQSAKERFNRIIYSFDKNLTQAADKKTEQGFATFKNMLMDYKQQLDDNTAVLDKRDIDERIKTIREELTKKFGIENDENLTYKVSQMNPVVKETPLIIQDPPKSTPPKALILSHEVIPPNLPQELNLEKRDITVSLIPNYRETINEKKNFTVQKLLLNRFNRFKESQQILSRRMSLPANDRNFQEEYVRRLEESKKLKENLQLKEKIIKTKPFKENQEDQQIARRYANEAQDVTIISQSLSQLPKFLVNSSQIYEYRADNPLPFNQIAFGNVTVPNYLQWPDGRFTEVTELMSVQQGLNNNQKNRFEPIENSYEMGNNYSNRIKELRENRSGFEYPFSNPMSTNQNVDFGNIEHHSQGNKFEPNPKDPRLEPTNRFQARNFNYQEINLENDQRKNSSNHQIINNQKQLQDNCQALSPNKCESIQIKKQLPPTPNPNKSYQIFKNPENELQMRIGFKSSVDIRDPRLIMRGTSFVDEPNRPPILVRSYSENPLKRPYEDPVVSTPKKKPCLEDHQISPYSPTMSITSSSSDNTKRRFLIKQEISKIVIAELNHFFDLRKFGTNNPRGLFKDMARVLTHYFHEKNPDEAADKNAIKDYIMEVFYDRGIIVSSDDFLLKDDD